MFTGSMVAIATPMNEDGSIDFASYENLIEFHISNSTDAIVPVGTTGESATIDNAEHCEIVSFVVDKVAKATNSACGCNKRRDTLNRVFPYDK